MTTKQNTTKAPNAEQLKAIEKTFKNCLNKGTNNAQELGEVIKALSAEINNRKETARDYQTIARLEVKQREAGNQEEAEKINATWCEELKRDQVNALIQSILINNIKFLIQELGTKYIAEIIARYDGKQYGAKTRDKISADFRELAQMWGLDWLGIEARAIYFRLTNWGGICWNGYEEKTASHYPIYSDWKMYTGNNAEIINESNTIKAEALQSFHKCGALPVYDIERHICEGFESIAQYNEAQKVAEEKRENIRKYYPVFNKLIKD